MRDFFVFGCLPIILVFVLLFPLAYVCMLLWNYVIPSLFGLRDITYWEMFALMFLARLMFGNYVNINKGNS